MSLQRIGNRKAMKARLEKSGMMSRVRNRCILIALSVAFWWLLFVYRFVSDGHPSQTNEQEHGSAPLLTKWQQGDSLKSSFNPVSEKFTSRDALSQADSRTFSDETSGDCTGRYIFMHDLPREFNEGLLEDCENLNLWADMCKETVNNGFGQPMSDSEGVFSDSGWYSTNQFNLEVIFHHRVKQFKCLTTDSSKANAVFIPFYAGYEVMPHLWDGANITHRDEVPLALVEWVTSRPEWSRFDGHDHFLIGGRVTWDFRRKTDEESDWGNKLLILDAVTHMTTLTIEASPWHTNDFGIPYPTYFHPSTDAEVQDWQDRVRNVNRKSLFCFAGAPRPDQDTSIRSQLMTQCRESQHCNLMECTKTAGKCHTPINVMRVFKESHFCLQPSGDSYTRRSMFDSILAGCIPVFFHPYSAYTQYGYHLPANHSLYSVFIHEDNIRANNVSVEEVLLRFSPEDIEAMRNVVIGLIPRIVYGALDNSLTLKDAFEISIDGLMWRIEDHQRDRQKKQKVAMRLKEDSHKSISEAKRRLDLLIRSGIRTR